jgi:hypothetical protein
MPNRAGQSTMKDLRLKRKYKPYGNAKMGYRIAIPSVFDRELAESYECTLKSDGTLIYIPVVQP